MKKHCFCFADVFRVGHHQLTKTTGKGFTFGCFGLVKTIYKRLVFNGDVRVPEGSMCYVP